MSHDGAADGLSRLIDLVNAGSMSMAVCVAAYLRVPDLLAAGPRDIERLAVETGSHAASLERVMRALCSLGLCEQVGAHDFALKPAGHALRSHAPHSLRAWLIWWGKYMWPVWGQLLHSVKTGESARRLLTGTEAFGHLHADKEAAAIFNDAMAEFTTLVAEELVRRYDFRDTRCVVDVGGGHGALIAAVLAANPGLTGVLLDLAHAMPGARAHLRSAGVEARCKLVEGDFFQSIPEGGDLYLLKAVLHDWNEERCASILRNCRRAMPARARLAIIERVMPQALAPCTQHTALARADLNMLVALGGRERGEPEFRALLDAAGFRLARVVDLAVEYSVIEALPV